MGARTCGGGGGRALAREAVPPVSPGGDAGDGAKSAFFNPTYMVMDLQLDFPIASHFYENSLVSLCIHVLALMSQSVCLLIRYRNRECQSM
jgi:hypothetical protein